MQFLPDVSYGLINSIYGSMPNFGVVEDLDLLDDVAPSSENALSPSEEAMSPSESIALILEKNKLSVMNKDPIELKINNDSAIEVLKKNPGISFPFILLGNDILGNICAFLPLEDFGRFAQINLRARNLTDERLIGELFAKNLNLIIDQKSHLSPKEQIKNKFFFDCYYGKVNILKHYIIIKELQSTDKTILIFNEFVLEGYFLKRCHGLGSWQIFYRDENKVIQNVISAGWFNKTISETNASEWKRVTSEMKEFEVILEHHMKKS